MPCLQFIIIISKKKEGRRKGREAGKEGKLSLQKEKENYMFHVYHLSHTFNTTACMNIQFHN